MPSRRVITITAKFFLRNHFSRRPFSTLKGASPNVAETSNTSMVKPSSTTMDSCARFHDYFQRSGSAKPPRILITGGMGQLGRSLAETIRQMYGRESVLLTDISMPPSDFGNADAFRYLNIMDRRAIDQLVVDYRADTIVHFSALLSAVGEQNVELALNVNCQGVQNVLNVAKDYKLKVFIPSTIGVFGPSTPRDNTPDLTVQRPRTIYGVTKVFAELLGEYYHTRFGVDFRSMRFPGIISDVQPGGGTTDYAIKIFYDALLYGRHTCYLRPDTRLPMMYNTDCMASIIGCLLAPPEALSIRTYNVTGFSFTPAELAAEIRRHQPNFEITYDVCPVRQAIADSWPRSLDDSIARRDWGWRPEYDLEMTVALMFRLLGANTTPKTSTVSATNTIPPLYEHAAPSTVDAGIKISAQM